MPPGERHAPRVLQHGLARGAVRQVPEAGALPGGPRVVRGDDGLLPQQPAAEGASCDLRAGDEPADGAARRVLTAVPEHAQHAGEPAQGQSRGRERHTVPDEGECW